MDREMTAQEVARATLDSIELVRLACEGKPRKGEGKPRHPIADIFGDEPDMAWLGGLFTGKGKR